jgi:hypothetical protein
MLDPETGPYRDIDAELARLQRLYHVASYQVGEQSVRPDNIDDETLAWWIAAHRARIRRRHERSDTVTLTNEVEQVELRKSRLRKPSR